MKTFDRIKDGKAAVKGASLAVAALLFLTLTGCGKSSEEPEVISKRVKIEIKDGEGGEAGALPGETAPPAGVAMPADEIPPAPAPAAVAPAVETAKPLEPATTPEAKKEAPPEAVTEREKPAVKKAPPAPAPRVKVASRAPEGDWAINVASFTAITAARELRSGLKSAGYNAYITNFTKDGTVWHRVRVGFYRTKDEAMKDGNKIKERFKVQSPWVVKPPQSEKAGIDN